MRARRRKFVATFEPSGVQAGRFPGEVILSMNTALSAHMFAKADIVIDTPPKRLLVVDCTWFREPSLERVIDRRDSLAELWSINFDYFMLTLRGELYLWRNDAPSGSPPAFTAATNRIWRKYLGNLADQPDTLRSEVMEIAVAAWLNDLAHNVAKPDPESDADQLLLRSGLYEKMKRGIVRKHVSS